MAEQSISEQMHKWADWLSARAKEQQYVGSHVAFLDVADEVRAIAESIKALSDSWREEHDDRIRLEERCKRLQGRVEYWKQEAQGNDSALSELTSLMFPEDEQK